MRMLEIWSSSLGDQWEVGKMCWGMTWVSRQKILAEMSWKPEAVSVVLFAIGLNM